MLAPIEALTKLAEFANAAEQPIPDPVIYSDWFDRADEKRRSLSVGARKLATVQKSIGGRPSYEHFVDPATGEIMKLEALKNESPEDRTARVAAVRQEMDKRRRLIRQVKAFGFAVESQ